MDLQSKVSTLAYVVLVLSVILPAVLGYLLGSMNTSIVIGKLVYKTDIREHGSGNAGATNTLRVLGKKAAIMAVAGDSFKGIIACLSGAMITSIVLGAPFIGTALGGLFAVIGHNWPIYFKFKGGKGVMTTFAVAVMINWKAALISFVIFVMVVSITKFVSLGSIIAAFIFPFTAYFLGETIFTCIIVGLLALLIIVRHKANIARLIKGEENKVSFKKK